MNPCLLKRGVNNNENYKEGILGLTLTDRGLCPQVSNKRQNKGFLLRSPTHLSSYSLSTVRITKGPAEETYIHKVQKLQVGLLTTQFVKREGEEWR